MRALAFALAAALACAGLSLVSTPAFAEGPLFKDLQVLPKNITKDDLKARMKSQAKALGVQCDHCHTPPDMEKDTKNKTIARQMMKMQNAINDQFLKGMDKKVTCDTCHRGKEVPESTAGK
jgi:hypothetical protein